MKPFVAISASTEELAVSKARKPFARTWLQLFSSLVLLAGLLLAAYFLALPWLDYRSAAQVIADPNHYLGWRLFDKMDRLTGVIFGFGLAFLGAFGLYVERDKPAQIQW